MPHNPDELKKHSEMLSQIAAEVDEWYIHEECTTLDAVKLVIADARKWRGIAEGLEVEKKYIGKNIT